MAVHHYVNVFMLGVGDAKGQLKRASENKTKNHKHVTRKKNVEGKQFSRKRKTRGSSGNITILLRPECLYSGECLGFASSSLGKIIRESFGSAPALRTSSASLLPTSAIPEPRASFQGLHMVDKPEPLWNGPFTPRALLFYSFQCTPAASALPSSSSGCYNKLTPRSSRLQCKNRLGVYFTPRSLKDSRRE